MVFGYADPPYPGLAWRYYRCAEVDHAELIASLVDRFPSGWALSTSARALRYVLPLCPPDARVAAWVRGARPGRSARPRSAWEPLIVVGGRRLPDVEPHISDALVASVNGRARSHPGSLVGQKTAAWCEWMFAQLGALRGDSLVDLFPGSGVVGRAWAMYQGARRSGKPSRYLEVANP